MRTEIRSGWRYFECSSCGHKWRHASRDAKSPSGELCPQCDEWGHPIRNEIDHTIPVDNFGNLLVPWDWKG